MMGDSRLAIGMIGSKGIPASFGGIERHVEEIGRRLAERGHRVTVYGRRPFSTGGTYRGVRVRLLPSVPTKHLDAATHSLIATLAALAGRFDVIHYHGIGPSLFSWIPAALGRTTVSTVHAPDYRQSKWGPLARSLLRRGEATAVRRCDAAIAVSRHMARLLSAEYGREVRYIPNGANPAGDVPFSEARRFGIAPGEYILTVGRFIVEKEFHTLLRAFRRVETSHRLVVVGDARFEEEYAALLRSLADERVIFPGYVSGALLDELYAHCSFFVLPSLVEGLPISLIEAMSFARPVLVSDIPENLEVAEGVAVTFASGNEEELAKAIAEMLSMDRSRRAALGAEGRARVEREYSWERITDEIEELYRDLVARRRPRR